MFLDSTLVKQFSMITILTNGSELEELNHKPTECFIEFLI